MAAVIGVDSCCVCTAALYLFFPSFQMFIMEWQTFSYILFFLALFLIAVYLIVSFVVLLSVVGGWCTMHNKVDMSMSNEDLPGISIIKPLMGIDPLLESNLESHFTLKYPKFELLFCVQDEEDPVINLVHKLNQKYSNVDTRIFIGGKNGIINPLVHNIAPAYDGAKYEFVWISTSRIRVNTEIAYDLTTKLKQSNVGLVHQMPFTTDQAGMASAIDKVYFGAAMARFYISANILGILIFTGMSYMLKKSALDEVNGLGYYGKYLAEDYFLSKALFDRGYKTRVSSIPAQQNVVESSIAAYKDRMVRWLRLRMNMMPVICGIFEPMTECIPVGLLGAWAFFYMCNAHPWIFFGCHVLIWFILDYIRLRIVQGGPLHLTKLKFLVAWLIRELLYVFIYFEALLNVNRIKWGKRTYKVTLGGHTEIMNTKPLLPL